MRQSYKIFNIYSKGPLYCGDRTVSGNYDVSVNQDVDYEDDGKERWNIERQDDGKERSNIERQDDRKERWNTSDRTMAMSAGTCRATGRWHLHDLQCQKGSFSFLRG